MASLDDLPTPALLTLFELTSLDAMARACCVSRAWRRALSQRHLWADLVFDAARMDVVITERTIRGACAKAGSELTSVTLPDASLLFLVPALRVVHPALTHVALLPGLIVGAATVHALLRFGVTDVRIGLYATHAEVRDGTVTALLSHPGVRVHTLRLQEEELSENTDPVQSGSRLLEAVTAALGLQRQHVMHLHLERGRGIRDAVNFYDDVLNGRQGYENEELRPYRLDAGGSVPDADGATGVVTAFAAALAACPRLRSLDVPLLLTHDAFLQVLGTTESARTTRLELHSFSLAVPDDDRFIIAGLDKLLPRLRRLELLEELTSDMLGDVETGRRSTTDFLLPMLNGSVRTVKSIEHVAGNGLEAAHFLEELVLHSGQLLDERDTGRLFEVLTAAPFWSTTLRSLTLLSASEQTMRACQAALAGSSLTSLTLLRPLVPRPGTRRELTAAPLQALLQGVDAAPCLTRLTIANCGCWVRLHHQVLAGWLQHNTTLRELTLNDCDWRQEGADLLAASLLENRTLTDLTVNPAYDGMLLAMANALDSNAGLRRVTAHVQLPEGIPRGTSASIAALASGAVASATLTTLRVVAHICGSREVPDEQRRSVENARNAHGVVVGRLVQVRELHDWVLQ